jgi:hypothetical protein
VEDHFAMPYHTDASFITREGRSSFPRSKNVTYPSDFVFRTLSLGAIGSYQKKPWWTSTLNTSDLRFILTFSSIGSIITFPSGNVPLFSLVPWCDFSVQCENVITLALESNILSRRRHRRTWYRNKSDSHLCRVGRNKEDENPTRQVWTAVAVTPAGYGGA